MKHFLEFALLLIFYNMIPFVSVTKLPAPVEIVFIVALSLFFLVSLVRNGKKSSSKKLARINKGCRQVKYSGFAAVSELAVLPLYIVKCNPETVNLVFSIVFPVVFIALTLFVGIMRIAVSSKQVKLTDHIALLLCWWVPVVNIFLFRKFYKTGRREYIFESDRIALENARAENEVCKTKYPVLMVHGIFFRDWQYFNYWGRVPSSLISNGASVYYGNQQSATSIERSASELKERIEQVIAETGAEKVNIIAHSKGGLDSRYAISRLGMDKYVATLTTINSPHHGCDMVDYLLDKLPKSVVDFVADKYNRLFTGLGDNNPDFLAGVNDLRASRAEKFNADTPDAEGVSYRSYMTVMSSWNSAFFPLSVSYLIIKKLNGANDGLVYAESARHGDYTFVEHKKHRGICHGDVIDLMRENIDGYDVREFYVDIVKKLREQGY